MASQIEHIVLVGGPADGRIFPVEGIPTVWRVPQLPPLSTLILEFAEPTTNLTLNTLTYRPALDSTGHPSRRDDGTLVYELSPGDAARLARKEGEETARKAARTEAARRARECHPTFDLTKPLRWPAHLVCNCGVPLGVARDIGELEKLLSEKVSHSNSRP